MKNSTPCPVPKILVRAPYHDYFIDDTRAARSRPSFVSGPSQVRPEFADESDINNVVLRYSSTGELPPRLNHVEPEWADVSDIPDLQVALDLVRSAHETLDRVRAEQAALAQKAVTDAVTAASTAARATNPEPGAPSAPPASSPVPGAS